MPEACALDVAATGVADGSMYCSFAGYDEKSKQFDATRLDGGGPLSHCAARRAFCAALGGERGGHDTARCAVVMRFCRGGVVRVNFMVCGQWHIPFIHFRRGILVGPFLLSSSSFSTLI